MVLDTTPFDKYYRNTARTFKGTIDTTQNVSGWTIKFRFGHDLAKAVLLEITGALDSGDPTNKTFQCSVSAAQSLSFIPNRILTWEMWRTDPGAEDVIIHEEILVVDSLD